MTEEEVRKQFFCHDCGIDTINEYYMVKHKLWKKAVGRNGMLCILCLENRLGRKLKPKDFVGMRGYLAIQEYLKGTRFPLGMIKILPPK